MRIWIHEEKLMRIRIHSPGICLTSSVVKLELLVKDALFSFCFSFLEPNLLGVAVIRYSLRLLPYFLMEKASFTGLIVNLSGIFEAITYLF